MNPRRFAQLSGIFLCCSLLAFAQLQTGEIRLEVKDTSGVAMDAAGTLESLSAGVRRTFETGQTGTTGTHTFTALPFGRYRLLVGHPGFATQDITFEVRSAVPISRSVVLDITPIQSVIEVHDQATLLDTESTGAAQHLGPDDLQNRPTSAPGRSVIDLVNQQPGWLLEANGVLHPRGSEYDVQYVIDGIPLYDNRSPAFAQSLGVDDCQSMTVRTANYPAAFGRKLGGVIEVNTEQDRRKGLHGSLSLQGGSFSEASGFASVQ